jgi:hypothetical protein
MLTSKILEYSLGKNPKKAEEANKTQDGQAKEFRSQSVKESEKVENDKRLKLLSRLFFDYEKS